MKFIYVAFAACMLALAAGASGATPDQVGTWVGTLKTKVYSPSGVIATKDTMQVEIAADDTTTVTIAGQVQLPATTEFSPGEGLISYYDPLVLPDTTQIVAVAHFKGTKMKGTTSGLRIGAGLVETFLGKFKLKKQ